MSLDSKQLQVIQLFTKLKQNKPQLFETPEIKKDLVSLRQKLDNLKQQYPETSDYLFSVYKAVYYWYQEHLTIRAAFDENKKEWENLPVGGHRMDPIDEIRSVEPADQLRIIENLLMVLPEDSSSTNQEPDPDKEEKSEEK